MLTVFREMAHSIARQLAHLDADSQRLGRGVSDEQQDAVLAEVLERAIEDGQRAVERTPEQLEVLRESGVVDAGGYGLVLILAGVVAGLRGDGTAVPEVDHQEAPRLSRPHHEDSRFRYCTNFIVSGSGLDSREHLSAARGPRRLGPRRRRRGDAQGPRPHRRARGRRGALRGRRRGHQPRRRRHARAGRRTARTPAARQDRRARGRRRRGVRAALRRARRPRRAGRRDAQPVDLRAARRHPRGPGRGSPRPAQLRQRDHGRRARLRALREAGPGGALDLPAGEPAGPGRARPGGALRTRTPSGSTRRSRGSPAAASPRRPATTPRAASARATRSASPPARSSPGEAPARPSRRRSSASPRAPRSSP